MAKGPEYSSLGTFHEQVQCLTNENVQLQDRNEKLYSKVEELQEKLGQLALSKADMSSRLICSEEEKLKISKDFVDFQIDTNKKREQHEAENFELKNLILGLENRILEIELHDERTTGERDALQERLQTLENDHKELANEYLALKSNYLVLGKEHEQELSKSEELSRELLNLVKSKQEHPHHVQTKSLESQTEAEEPSAEVERVQTLIHRFSARRAKPKDVVAASEHEDQKLEKSLLRNQGHITEEMEKMREMYSSQQQKLEERMITMGKELQEAKKAIRNTQHKLAEESAILLSSHGQLQEVESENSRLQLQLKELNEQYRSHLVQYITDLAEYTDSKSSAATKEPAQMKRFVDSMLKDIRASYKSREEQLARAARGYKKRMQNLVKKHEGLLVAYRMQREQIRSLGSPDLDPGPPEHHFSITDAELLTNTSQELNRLREDKASLEGQLYELQMKVKLSEKMISGTSFHPLPPPVPSLLEGDGWAELRKQLREFTHATQVELEKERSQLLARAMVAEEQVAELQEYVDKHLVRYKQEIVRMHKLLGTDGSRELSAGASAIPVLLMSQRNLNKEV
ncbi:coiled-coil domain-containing protein 78 isoform X3 [Crotalus tigris]|uniref:coiled-coil domain-containing protein 78 isoform X3 n=1 Tax=Crotalus tigris TaxID=88082 RepID=UPI00192F1DBD|nr:coiled-coil domain-containing protein 78 isoform X3 [Crotalus tigris]